MFDEEKVELQKWQSKMKGSGLGHRQAPPPEEHGAGVLVSPVRGRGRLHKISCFDRVRFLIHKLGNRKKKEKEMSSSVTFPKAVG